MKGQHYFNISSSGILEPRSLLRWHNNLPIVRTLNLIPIQEYAQYFSKTNVEERYFMLYCNGLKHDKPCECNICNLRTHHCLFFCKLLFAWLYHWIIQKPNKCLDSYKSDCPQIDIYWWLWFTDWVLVILVDIYLLF